MGEIVTWSPEEWMPGTILYIIATITSLKLLMFEVKKRKRMNASFTTKSLQYSSIICMTAAFIVNLIYSINDFYVLCNFISVLAVIALAVQMVFMGFYQLARLHYCFANDKIYSNKGYPNWVFNVMIIIGILLIIHFAIFGMFYPDMHPLNIKCGINSKLEFYYIPLQIISAQYYGVWLLVNSLSFLAWDITTVSLYYHKIRYLSSGIKNKDERIYKRVLSILYRVFITTLFYEISMFVLTSVLGIVIALTDSIWIIGICSSITVAFCTNAVSISIFLMMDHNKSEYIEFLKIIKKLRLNWLCCGYYYIVDDQLLELQETGSLQLKERTDIKGIDTRDATLPQALQEPDMQLSELTVTHD